MRRSEKASNPFFYHFTSVEQQEEAHTQIHNNGGGLMTMQNEYQKIFTIKESISSQIIEARSKRYLMIDSLLFRLINNKLKYMTVKRPQGQNNENFPTTRSSEQSSKSRTQDSRDSKIVLNDYFHAIKMKNKKIIKLKELPIKQIIANDVSSLSP